jgi:hypothetical protein
MIKQSHHSVKYTSNTYGFGAKLQYLLVHEDSFDDRLINLYIFSAFRGNNEIINVNAFAVLERTACRRAEQQWPGSK